MKNLILLLLMLGFVFIVSCDKGDSQNNAPPPPSTEKNHYVHHVQGLSVDANNEITKISKWHKCRDHTENRFLITFSSTSDSYDLMIEGPYRHGHIAGVGKEYIGISRQGDIIVAQALNGGFNITVLFCTIKDLDGTVIFTQGSTVLGYREYNSEIYLSSSKCGMGQVTEGLIELEISGPSGREFIERKFDSYCY